MLRHKEMESKKLYFYMTA